MWRRIIFQPLDGTARVAEVAAMIAGDGAAKSARSEARRLLALRETVRAGG